MNKCVYCDSTENLNVQMTIPYKDNKVTVWVCDQHAEDASVKSAKVAYEDKQRKIDEFLEQAKSLGIEVQEGPSGLVLVRDNKPKPQSQLRAQPIIQQEDMVGEDVVDTAKLERSLQSVGGSTEFGNIESHTAYRVSGERDVLPSEVLQGKAKLTVVEGRSGAPIAIPSKRVDGTGTTQIRIIKKENDQSLQRRFKHMADNSMQDRTPNFAQGYSSSTTTCPICRGDGTVSNQMCPKCDGNGIIPLY